MKAGTVASRTALQHFRGGLALCPKRVVFSVFARPLSISVKGDICERIIVITKTIFSEFCLFLIKKHFVGDFHHP